jgi:hypothetical protein
MKLHQGTLRTIGEKLCDFIQAAIFRYHSSANGNHLEKEETQKKRKRGGPQGHPKHSRQLFPADAIDETIIHKLADEEVKHRKLTELPKTALALQQISLPKKLYRITEHRVQLYQTCDGKIISAKLPPEIRKAGLFAPDMTALVGYLKGRCHASYSTLRAIFSDIFGLNIECGYLSKLCTKKVSAALEPMYDEVLETIRQSPVVGSDETGHQNSAFKSAWTWCWQTPSSHHWNRNDFPFSKSLNFSIWIDLHSNNSYLGIADIHRKRYNKKLPNDLSRILTHIEPYREVFESIIIESTYN